MSFLQEINYNLVEYINKYKYKWKYLVEIFCNLKDKIDIKSFGGKMETVYIIEIIVLYFPKKHFVALSYLVQLQK